MLFCFVGHMRASIAVRLLSTKIETNLEMTQVLMMQRVGTVLCLVVEELDVTRTCVFSVLDQLLLVSYKYMKT